MDGPQSARHERLLDELATNVRADLWERLGITNPLTPQEVVVWILSRWREQDMHGDRLSLRFELPNDRVPGFKKGERREGRRPFYSRYVVHEVGTSLEEAIPTALRLVWWADAFAGVYLEDDLTRWPPPDRWKTGIDAGIRQPLALLALAASSVEAQTGGAPEAATAFLMCDRRFPHPGVRISHGGGWHMWITDPDLTAVDLRREYAVARQLLGMPKRARRLSSRPDELAALVARMRPEDGDKKPWRDVLESWNATHDEKYNYSDPNSIATAWRAALRRREQRNQRGGETDDNQ